MPFYERGPVRIHYEEVGSGFPLLLIPGGGLNSALSSWQTASPFNPMERYKNDFRSICADLRNANPGQSSGPLDRPGLALRRSAQMQRKSSLYLSIGLKGEAVCQDERAELSPPPGMSSRGKPEPTSS
jgi:pimeloyl-ACP methyl ester carboxylesterase